MTRRPPPSRGLAVAARAGAALTLLLLLAAAAGCESRRDCIVKCMARLEQNRGPVDACDLKAERAAPSWLRKCRLPEERAEDKPGLKPCTEWVETCKANQRLVLLEICDDGCAGR